MQNDITLVIVKTTSDFRCKLHEFHSFKLHTFVHGFIIFIQILLDNKYIYRYIHCKTN